MNLFRHVVQLSRADVILLVSMVRRMEVRRTGSRERQEQVLPGIVMPSILLEA